MRYISEVEFCGKNDEVYKELECNLYEEYNNTKTKISSYEKGYNLTLKSYLKKVSINVNNYSSVCKKFSSSNMYIEVNVTSGNNETKVYKVPLKLKDNCD